MTMVAFSARNEKEIKQICKEHKIKMRQSTIDWWLDNWSSSGDYLCISVENGVQKGGGHICDKHELDSSTIILTTRRRLI